MTDDSFKYNKEDIWSTVVSINEDKEVSVVLDRTNFYAEKGGQKSDVGLLITEKGGCLLVDDVQVINGEIVHKGTLSGSIEVGDSVLCCIDKEVRDALSRGHTGAHAFDEFLFGDNRKRDDFSVQVFPDMIRIEIEQAVYKDEEIERIQNHFQKLIQEEREIITEILPVTEALKRDDILSVFKDKYPENVRIVTISGLGKQVCGGTHLMNTKELLDAVVVVDRSQSVSKRKVIIVFGYKALQVRETLSKVYYILDTSGDISYIENVLKVEGSLPIRERRSIDEKLKSIRKIRLEEKKIEDKKKMEELTSMLESFSFDKNKLFLFERELEKKEVSLLLSKFKTKRLKQGFLSKGETSMTYGIYLGDINIETIVEALGGKCWMGGNDIIMGNVGFSNMTEIENTEKVLRSIIEN
eukprot:GHVP01063117.1.p1 GENE.GHVP01063117.1~~GHVP01063117.1.p1  ORF type:complete len:412 (+),score=91.65 GHVP01063117.1:1023-2258(+)